MPKCSKCEKEFDDGKISGLCKINLSTYINSKDSMINKKRLSKLGIKNPMWKGKNVGYAALHEWIKNRKKKPPYCEECGINIPLDLANISGKYKRDINDFEWLCRKCHMIKDNRIQNLINSNIKRSTLDLIKCLFCKKVFKPRVHYQKCCSRHCGQKQRNKNEKKM